MQNQQLAEAETGLLISMRWKFPKGYYCGDVVFNLKYHPTDRNDNLYIAIGGSMWNTNYGSLSFLNGVTVN